MRHDIISIMECDIEGAVSQHDAGKAAYREKEKEAQNPKYGGLKRGRGAVQSGESRKNFDTSRHRDDYSGRGEVSARVYVYPHRKHVMGPDHESEQRDGAHSIDHTERAEPIAFRGVVVYDLGNYPKPGED